MVPFETKSANAFIQHLAIRLIGNGYVYYVLGNIPKNKDPKNVDEKFIVRYGVGESKWAQFRNRERGQAKIRYLRFGHKFILVATEGAHLFFSEEEKVLCDVRRFPISCFGYQIRVREDNCGKFHPIVRLTFSRLIGFRMELLSSWTIDEGNFLSRIRSEKLLWFSGVKRQIFRIVKEINHKRRAAGLPPVFLPGEFIANHSLRVFGK